MKTFGRSGVGAIALVFFAVVGERSARAAGFATARFGGEHGNVTETNPFALYYNPGALGFSHSPLSSMLDVQVALRDASWTHTAPQPGPSQQPDSQVGNSGTATLFNAFGAPAIGVTSKLGNLGFGIGFFVPFGGFAHWDTNNQLDAQALAQHCLASVKAPPCPRAAEGVARWHIIDGEVSSIYFSAGVGYRLGPLSIGVSGNAILSTTRLSQAKNPNGATLPDSTSEGRATLEVSGVNGSFGAGAMLELVPNRAWLGASYQAQPGLGQQTLTGTLDINDSVLSHPALQEHVSFIQWLPDIIRGGARWRVSDAVELRVFGDYTRWSVLKAQCVALEKKQPDGSFTPRDCNVYPNGSDATGGAIFTNIPRNWNDTYGVRVGGSYWMNPGVEFFAGVGYETGAVPDSTLEPTLMDADNVAGALGTRLMFEDGFYFAVSYTHLQFFDRDNTGKSQLETNNGVPVAYPTVQQDGGGKYTQWIGIIDANIQKDF
jgi:long-chain fatty acid transport protein